MLVLCIMHFKATVCIFHVKDSNMCIAPIIFVYTGFFMLHTYMYYCIFKQAILFILGEMKRFLCG